MAAVHDLGWGIHRIELPLPIPRLPFVNAYVFPGEEGPVVVDPGAATEDGYLALKEGLAGLGHDPGDLAAVIATHLHPDHMGLCTRLAAETGCDYVMHATAASRVAGYNDWAPWRARLIALARRNGAPEHAVAALGEEEPRPAWAAPSMIPNVLVEDGAAIPLAGERHLAVVHTPGHDESHVCLVDSASGLLFSGDHVLPRITPFVPYPEEDGDNLGTYLASLRRIEEIDPPRTLPAHLEPIERGAARAHQIALHHRRRLEGMTERLRRSPASAWAVMEDAFKPDLPPLHARLAFQETLAHLEYLRHRGRAERFEEEGTVLYTAPSWERR